MADEWYFTTGGHQAGPVEWTQLKDMTAAGQVGANELVWCEAMPEWVPACTVPGLFGPASAPQAPVGSAPDAIPPLPPKQTSYIPQYAMADPYFNGRATSTVYAGFWLRFFASLVDGFLLILIMIPVLAAFIWIVGMPDVPDATATYANAGTSAGGMQSNPTAGIVLRIVLGLIGWLYFAYQESSSKQATLGKRLLGLIVTDENGQRISFGKATGRHFGKIVSQIILCYGYIMAGTTERKQALHDIIASCLVVIKSE